MEQTHLSHKHAHTLQLIFQHPTSHNLEWRAVTALVEHNGTVLEEANGKLTFTLSGVTETFHRSQAKDVAEVQQVLDIRRFLENAGVHKDGTMAQAGNSEPEQHSHDHGHVNAEQNRHAEQQLKNQQHEQNDRSGFQGGSAQAHQQGNRHH